MAQGNLIENGKSYLNAILHLLLFVTERTQLNATHVQSLKKLRPIALGEMCQFLTMLEFQEIWQKNRSETT